MPQLFRRSANTVAKVSIVGGILLLGAVISFAYIIDRGPWMTFVGVTKDQPIMFSHKHHVKDDGIDCRYCHTSVENSHFAGVPPTETCMSCHSQLWTNSTQLQKVKQSWESGKSIEWQRVHDLPEFVYFNHSIHVNKGIGCSTCHGKVNEMPLMYRVNTLYMQWCLNCHRQPEKFVRPRSEVFNIDYEAPPADQQASLGKKLVAEYHIQKLQDCTTCHR